MRIQGVFKSLFCRRFASTASNPDRRSNQGPWLSRDLLPNKGPVLVIDYKDLSNSRLNATEKKAGRKLEQAATELLTDFRSVASFNWSGSPEKPIMIIPGAPKLYRKSWTGGEVKADVDERIVSRHMYMTPDYPMESVFVAMQKCAELENRTLPSFNKYDIAIDRTLLRTLFEYCRRRGAHPRTASGGGHRVRDTRVDVELVGDRLIVFNRREPSIYDVPAASGRLTFGQDFRSKITEDAPLFSGPSSNRLLEALNAASPSSADPQGTLCAVASYRFGGLKLIVRFNVSCVDIEKSQLIGPPIHHEEYAIQSIPGSNISCVYAGQRWDYYTVELTTRVQTRPFPRYKWPQMYFSQVDAAVIGWYEHDRSTRGVVQVTPRLYSLEECKTWAEKNINVFADEGYDEKTLTLLCNLLHRIVDFVRCQPSGKKFAVIWASQLGPQLQLFEKSRSSSNVLPDYLLKDLS